MKMWMIKCFCNFTFVDVQLLFVAMYQRFLELVIWTGKQLQLNVMQNNKGGLRTLAN